MATAPAWRRVGQGASILAIAVPMALPWQAIASDLPVAIAVPMVSKPDARPPEAQSPVRAMPVGVVINGRPLVEPCLIVSRQGQLFVRQDMPRQWGLRLPEGMTTISVDGADFSLLDGLPGLSARLDSTGATLLIDAAPSLFPGAHVGGGQRSLPVMEAAPAQYIGYDLSLSRTSGQWAASAFLDAGVSGGWGVLGTTALVQQGMGSRAVVRLDSNFIRDFPDERLRLILGDAVTRGADWNQPVRFAGVRLGTDFSLAPDDITYALPRFSGSSALPSVVELAAASSRQTLTMQPGDFTIDYQPVFTGAGEVTMTVRDANGAARTVTRSFYTSPRLLREGLDDFSLEAGFLRRNFGGRSFSYGAPFGAGFWRHGLGGGLTLAGRVEASGDVQMAGLGLGLILSSWGEVTLSGAGSQSRSGDGFMWRAQFQRITPRYSVTASYQEEGAAFVQVGDALPSLDKRREFIVAGSLPLGRIGSVNANYLENDMGQGHHFATGSLSYGGNIGPAWLAFGVRQTRTAEQRNNSLFGSFTLPLGARSSAGLFVDGKRIAASVTHTPPPDEGWGYRLLASREEGGVAIAEGGLTWRTAAGDIDLSASRWGDTEAVRLQARGALLRAGGRIVAVPQLDYAFAVVDVTADQEVTVLFENRPVARKAGEGRRAVITGLQPYSVNRIAVDLDDLPIDTMVMSAEKSVVPGYRQAVRVNFGGPSARPVTLHVVDAGGAAVPEGLAVSTGGSVSGISGHDGAIFLADAQEGQEVVLRGAATACRAVVPALPVGQSMAKIAPVPCMPLPEGQ
ncbi:fimbria/pilus outer membrane usher protein [Sphingobium sp. Sx8-8]|uniref:fimbria/pilus outer membrane usher protein n=1 Tax=Sphingobium sp. Sx8-8 TaxID=2933617 RepID=UPI001F5A7F3A|nr:fimbria/pilus outer membrane usher protein [Sphingobium sp. Sx8-8]